MTYKDTPLGKMPDTWGIAKIKDIAKVVTDYVANGSFASLAENVTYRSEEDIAVLIRLVDYNNDFKGDFVFIDEHAYEFLSKSKLFGGEIIISNVGANVGTVFRCPVLKYKMSLAPNAIMVQFNGNDSFYYHWFKGHYGQKMLKSIVTGSAQPKFNKTNFKDMLVPVPPIEVQNKIASLLDAIELKIAQNTAINENLEQQAQALFKAHFGNNNLQTVRFGDIATFKYGKMPKKDKISVEGYPLFSGYQIVGYYPEKMFDEPQIIVVARGVGGCGDIKYTPSNCYLTNLSIAITPNDSAFEDYLYRLLKNTDMKILNTGSAQPQITVDSLQKFEIEIPSREDAMLYSSIITPIKIQYRLNNAENQRLAALRDTLLPKLMNGEIDVSAVRI
ncbi:restriction endonuclease subunit S [Ruminococcus sp. FC2018]|uniref:restriction endonuclease subunit S n=1 Tax=Ruminococcus sp. FC2018 TaxID=1410617 RepID=UPI00048BD5BD|nr:restriction endonuclease subunit S [Ruminococcus sp. FC2018]